MQIRSYELPSDDKVAKASDYPTTQGRSPMSAEAILKPPHLSRRPLEFLTFSTLFRSAIHMIAAPPRL
jgi:hypothetical protein